GAPSAAPPAGGGGPRRGAAERGRHRAARAAETVGPRAADRAAVRWSRTAARTARQRLAAPYRLPPCRRQNRRAVPARAGNTGWPGGTAPAPPRSVGTNVRRARNTFR